MDRQKKLKSKVLVFAILILAFVLRFWKLGEYPALNADEAAIGYNAYSLIQTGGDEHGNDWPIHFQSFNDYKPGLYFYMVLPFVRFVGLNEWGVRIPGAFLGVATVYLVYLLVKELFKEKSLSFDTNHLALIASFMLAISPWHIHFSRGGWEVNVATFFIVLALWLFFKGFNNIVFLFLSSISFILSMYAYHAARMVVPFIGLGLVTVYWTEVKKIYKRILLAGLVGFVALLPLISDFTNSDVGSRAAGVGLFADTGPIERINEQRGEHIDFQGVIPRVLHNKVINYALAFLDNWTDHYNGNFLFISGDVIQRNKVPETGQMYLFDLFLLAVGVIGIVGIFRDKSDHKRVWVLILGWLIVAPSAAALTFQSPHALRAQNMVVPITIISAYGLAKTLSWLQTQKKYIFTVVLASLIIIVAWNVTRYLHMYWVHMAKEYPFSSQYGVKELVSYISENSNEFEKVIVSDRYDQPYILFLFYLKYSPIKFQPDHVLTPRDTYGFSTVGKFDKFVFKKIDWDNDKLIYPRSLIVGTDEEIPDEANIIKEVYGTNDYKYFQVVAN